MAKNVKNQIVFPEWNKLGLANSGPLKNIHLQHCTWKQSPPQRKKRPNRERKEHVHTVFHIVVAEEGTGYFVINGDYVHVNGPALFLTDPGVPHFFGCIEDETIIYHEFTFTAPFKNWDALITAIFEKSKTIERHRQLNIQQCLNLSKLLHRVLEIGFEKGVHARISIGALLYQALFEIFQMHLDEIIETRDIWEELRLYIDQHAEEALSLKELSERIHLSPKHVSRQFSRRFGLPPMQYKKKLLIEKAQTLLSTSNQNLDSIADSLGYCDLGHFCKVFKEQTGLTPSQFKKSNT